MNWAKYLWSNGHKGTVAALAYLLAASMFLSGALVMSYCFANQDGYAPLSFQGGLHIESPVSITSPGLDANFVVCNKSNKMLTASVSTKWMQQLDKGAVHVVLGRDFNAVEEPGCTNVVFTDAPIPVGVTSAKSTNWTYMVSFIVHEGDKTQIASLTSDVFLVVP